MAQKDRPVVLVPVSTPQARRLRSEGRLAGPLRGFAADDQLCATFDLEPGSEEAEFAAFQMASVASLLSGDCRLVLVGRPKTATPSGGTDGPNGAVELGELALRDIDAYFIDDDRGDALAQASRLVAGRGLDEAWVLPAVQTLLAEHPLSWHDVSELADHLATLEA